MRSRVSTRSPASGRSRSSTTSPLAPLTTLRVGGPADRLAAAETVDELVGAARAGGRCRCPDVPARQGQRPRRGRCRHPRPGDPRPGRRGGDRRHDGARRGRRLDDGAGQALRARRPGRIRLGDQHPRLVRRRGVGERRRARRRDGRRAARRSRSAIRGTRQRRTLARRRLRVRVPRVALQARPTRSSLAGTIELVAGRPERRSTALHRRAPGARAARPSRWPTRTRAASSATRRAIMPGASSRRPGLKGHRDRDRAGEHPPRELHRHRPRHGRAADVRALGDHVRRVVARSVRRRACATRSSSSATGRRSAA